MAWKPAPDELVETFGGLVPDDDPRVERRKMFGYPCAFASGNMFMGLHEDRMVLRLPDGPREELQEAWDAPTFEPWEGRTMREYVVVPRALLDRADELRRWIAVSAEYAASLPPKETRKRKPKR